MVDDMLEAGGLGLLVLGYIGNLDDGNDVKTKTSDYTFGMPFRANTTQELHARSCWVLERDSWLQC